MSKNTAPTRVKMDLAVNECAFCSANSVIGFCENCECRLCEICFENHKRGKAFRTHVTVFIADSFDRTIREAGVGEETRRKKSTIGLDIHKQKCNTHTDENQSFYCEKHDVLICGRCIVSNHKSCFEAVIDLNNVTHSAEQLDKSLSTLHGLEVETSNIIREIEENVKMSDSYKLDCLKDINTFHEVLVDKLNQLKKEAEKTIAVANKENVDNLEKAMTACKEQLHLVKQRNEQIENAMQNKHDRHLFVTLKRLENDIKEVSINNQSCKHQNHIRKFKFTRNSMLDGITQNRHLQIGTLTEVCDGSDELLEPTNKPHKSEMEEVPSSNTGKGNLVAATSKDKTVDVADLFHSKSNSSLFHTDIFQTTAITAYIPPPKQVNHLDQYIVRFLEESPKKLEDSLKEVFGRPKFARDTNDGRILQIECTVDPSDHFARQKVVTWRTNCMKYIKWIDDLVVDKHKVAPLLFDDVVAQLKLVTVAEPEAVAVHLDRKNSQIFIVGVNSDVQLLAKKIRQIVEQL